MTLYSFANCGNFNQKICNLKELILEENWGKQDGLRTHPVLHNYIVHYFNKVYSDGLIAFSKNDKGDEIACFNTGLLTPYYDDVYAYFEKNKNPKGEQEWFLADFLKSSSYKLSFFKNLPDIVHFFKSIDDLFYDTSLDLRMNAEHIVSDNFDRFPENLKIYQKDILINMIEGSIKSVNKRIKRNYKIAVPQFFKNTIQFLVPLTLTNSIVPDMVITVYKRENHYYGATCLTMEMAYNNARLLVKPESDWLKID